MKIVLRYWLKSRRAIGWLFLAIAISTACTVTESWYTVLLPRVIDSGSFEMSSIIMKFLAVTIASAIGMAISPLVQNRGYRRFYTDICSMYADVALNADYAVYTEYTASAIQSLQDWIQSASMIAKHMMYLVMQLVTMVASVIAIWIIGGWRILTPILIGYSIVGAVMIPCNKAHGKYEKQSKELMMSRNQDISNAIMGFQEVKLFRRKESLYSKINEKNETIFGIGNKRNNVNAIINAVIGGVDEIVTVILLAFMIASVSMGTTSAASALAIFTLASKLMEAMLSVLDLIEAVAEASGLKDQFNEFMVRGSQRTETGHIQMSELKDGIELKDVHFAYESTSQILTGVNLKIGVGQKIGICGRSGDGKSTLLKLLLKFYKRDSGEILIDGVDIDDIEPDSYYSKIGVVSQDVEIFPGTIRENIIFAKPTACEYEIVDACKKAMIYDDICSWKDGFNTEVGPEGMKLSGGERQRIALARMFLVNPSIVILDEATSALDNNTEQLVQYAIDQLTGKTVIIVAHRLTTIQNCDTIAVMNGGRIIEQGNHHELMERNGLYAQMYNAKEK